MTADAPRSPADLETLLRERAWVRRVARAIAGDPSEADDLEQDAWLAAMRTPPGDAGGSRAWFRRVLRNRFLEGLRSGGRRAERERGAARPEAQPSTEEIVARADAQRRVVDAVFALDEPWRTTVVLRYFENLDTAAIAARTGVPADTVRARLRKALDDLHRRLEPRERGGSAAWAIVLGAPALRVAPRVPPVPHAAPYVSAHPVSGGILVSSTSKLAAAAAVLLAVAGLTYWTLGDVGGRDAARAPGDGAGAGPASATGAPDGAAATRERARGRSARDAARPESGVPANPDAASLLGEVRLAAGDVPAAGADVVLRGPDGEVRVRTDARGAFRFDDAPVGAPLAVVASREGLAPAGVGGVRLARRETCRLETLLLDAPVVARVDVVGPAGEPVADAAVEAYRVRTRIERQDWEALPPEPDVAARTDAAGRAVLDAFSVGTWRFRATHPDFAPAGSELVPVLRGGVDVAVRLRLERGHTLEGRVVTSGGAPVAGARVLLLPPVEAHALIFPVPEDPRRIETVADEAGSYRFGAVPAGDHSLAVARPGSLPARIGILTIPSVTRFDAVLDGGVLTGRVTAEGSGTPIEGARIRAAVWRRHSPTFLTATSGADGRYTIDVPLGGILQGPARGEGAAEQTPVHFEVEKDGWAFAPEAGALPWRALWVLGGRTTEFDLVMRRAASLSGTVTADDGPVAGAEVLADVWNPLRGSLTSRTTTDPTGAYRFGGLPEGRARVVVRRAGYVQVPSPGQGWRATPAPDAKTVVDIPRGGEARLDVRVERGVELTGRVVTAGGAPVAVAKVTATSGEARAETTTDSEGAFVLAGLRADAEAKVRVVRDGFVDGTADARPAPGAANRPSPLTIVLEPLGNVRGRVAGPGAEVPEGAWVQVAPAKLALETGYEVVGVWQTTPRHAVGADGAFDVPVGWFAGAAADGIVVRAGAPRHAPAITARLAAPRGASADAGVLRLETGHRLEGRVVAADGSGPIPGAEIEFQNEQLPPALAQRRDWSNVGRDQTPFEWVARTDADGRFAIDGLPPWRYELRVNAEGFGGADPTVSVPREHPVTLELPRLKAVAGRVERADGTPVGGAIVVAHLPGQGPADQTESRADGTFEFRWLAEGRYVLEARRAWDVTSDVVATTVPDVEAGTRDVRIVMERAPGTIAGRCATPAGAAVPGAVIRLKPAKGGPILIARSAPDGAFEVAGLAEGAWSVTAEASRSVGPPQGFGTKLVAYAQEVPTGARGVVLEFQEAAPIAGKVVREDNSPAGGKLVVHARKQGGAWTLMCPLLPGGEFRFDNATPGTWTLTVVDAANGATLKTMGSNEVAAPRRDVRLVLGVEAALAGRVVDERGRPVAGAHVAARSAAGAVLPVTLADDQGRFQWTAAEGGSWTLEATDPSTGRAEVAGLAPGGGEVSLVLRAEATVSASVRGATDAPARGVVVALVAEGGTEALRLRTDSEGRFTARSLRAGIYEVRLLEQGGVAVSPAVPLGTVSSGAPETVLRIPAGG